MLSRILHKASRRVATAAPVSGCGWQAPVATASFHGEASLYNSAFVNGEWVSALSGKTFDVTGLLAVCVLLQHGVVFTEGRLLSLSPFQIQRQASG